MKLDVVKVCAGLIIILALLMGSSMATETTWRFSGFELYGYDINFTSHNATNVKNIDAENITSEKIGGVIYADQYLTIQDAINASDSDNDGYADFAVFVPCGTFLVADTYISLMNDSYLFGAGDCSIIKLADSQTYSFVNDRGTIYPIITNKNWNTDSMLDQNITIRDLKIDGNGLAQSNAYQGISFAETTNVLISNVHIVNTRGFAIAGYGIGNLNSSITDTIIENCYFERVSGLPLADMIATEAIGFKFISNTIYNYNGAGITTAYWNNSDISHNTIVSNNYGINIEGPSDSINTIVSNNYIQSRGNVFNKVKNMQLKDNIILNYTSSDNYGFEILGNVSMPVISGNDISGYHHGIWFAVVHPHKDFTIINNIIHNNSYSGILIGDTGSNTNFTIQGNSFRYNNVLNDGSYGAMRVSLSDSTISNNEFHGNNVRSIAFVANSGTNYVYNNNVKDAVFILQGSGVSYSTQNINFAPFDHGINTTAPTPFGAGDEYYNSTDNIKYVYDGSAWDVLTNNEYFGEAYIYNNAVDTVIETANTPIALRQITTGSVNGWTFDAGSTGGITAYANGGGGKVTVSDAAHGLSNEDIITIRGTTNYNGVFAVSDVSTDAFNITDTWVADDGASDWDQGASLTAGSNSAGYYSVYWQMSMGPAAGMTVKWMIYINTVAQTQTTAERKYAINDFGCCGSSGVLDISAGDVVWLSVQSDDTANILNKNGNLNLHHVR